MKKTKLIDIHTHIIPNVDDGAESFDESILMLEDMIDNGIEDVILTPHYQSVAQTHSLERQKSNFNKLKKMVNKRNLNINLYLGHEIRYQSHLNPNYNKLTLANSNYVLIEFSTRTKTDCLKVVKEIKSLNLIPIIAHVERYYYVKYNDLIKLKEAGALLQVNSSSITEKDGWFSSKELIEQMIEEELIDIIASDIHGINYRYHSVKIAYDYLKDKISEKYLNKLIYENPKKIIANKKD